MVALAAVPVERALRQTPMLLVLAGEQEQRLQLRVHLFIMLAADLVVFKRELLRRGAWVVVGLALRQAMGIMVPLTLGAALVAAKEFRLVVDLAVQA